MPVAAGAISCNTTVSYLLDGRSAEYLDMSNDESQDDVSVKGYHQAESGIRLELRSFSRKMHDAQ